MIFQLILAGNLQSGGSHSDNHRAGIQSWVLYSIVWGLTVGQPDSNLFSYLWRSTVWGPTVLGSTVWGPTLGQPDLDLSAHSSKWTYSLGAYSLGAYTRAARSGFVLALIEMGPTGRVRYGVMSSTQLQDLRGRWPTGRAQRAIMGRPTLPYPTCSIKQSVH